MGRVWKNSVRITKHFVTMASLLTRQPEFCPKYCLKNSVRNPRRSVLTIASLAVSLCLLGVVGALYTVLYIRDAAPAPARRLVTRHRVSLTQPLPLFYRDKIRQVPGVQAITVSQWFGGIYKDRRNFQNFFARFGVE